MASLDHYYGQTVEAVTEDDEENGWMIRLSDGTLIRTDADVDTPVGLEGRTFMSSEEQDDNTIMKFGIPAETDDILEPQDVTIPTDSYTISYGGQTEEKEATLEEALPEDPTPERVVDAPLEPRPEEVVRATLPASQATEAPEQPQSEETPKKAAKSRTKKASKE